VVAAPGYGKTTALHRWFPQEATVWHRGDDVPDLIAGGLAELAGDGDLQLVIDDLPRLAAEDMHALLEATSELSGAGTVALSSRWPLDTPATNWRGRAPLARVRPADLALSVDQVAQVLAAQYGMVDPSLPERVLQATAGWPALVHLTAETLLWGGVPSGALLPAIAEKGTPLATYLADEVLAGLPADVRRLVHDIADLAPVTVGVCDALGYHPAGPAVRLLAHIGVLVPVGHGPTAGPCLVPAIAVAARRGRQRAPWTRTLGIAAAWYAEHALPLSAARAFHQVGDEERCARILDEHGEGMLAAGSAAGIAALIAAMPERLCTRRLRLLRGDALRTAGDVAAAAHAYQVVAATEPQWDAGIAWRMGLVHYLRGDPRTALATFARGGAVPGSAADDALLLAWTAAAHLRLGDLATATENAWRAYHRAADAGHDGALATAHITLALCLAGSGDQVGRDEHYDLALRIAERTGDMVLLTRILTNQTHHLIHEARYPAALDTARRAVQCAMKAGHANLRSIATGNEATVLTRLGRYDEAVEQYERVLVLCRQMGSRRSAAAMYGLGEVHRRRGWREQARAAFEEAARLADEGGNVELTVAALASLARVEMADDPMAAAAHADDAVRRAADGVLVDALLAQGWVAAHTGDLDRALRLTEEVARIARAQCDRAGLAEALELRAATVADPARARAALREAHGIWSDAGAMVDAARALVSLGHLPGASTEDRLGAVVAGERLAAAGIPPGTVGWAAGGSPDSQVDVLTLGRFDVLVAGEAVPASQWQSRKARDLLRILVARRGRPVPRSELCELLWPDDDPGRTGHRLSVLLSIVRGVLDPGKAFDSDHYLVADQSSIALDITRLRIDVEDFLAAVARGRRLQAVGAVDEAHAMLAAATRGYRADAFSDEPYPDWSGPLREEARAAYLTALRILAGMSRAAGDGGDAVGYLLRLLEHDRYDEAAHRSLVQTLVAAGQHGEARRAFVRYRAAMREIGVRPPDEALLTPGSVPVVGAVHGR
jgi:DNA-binding SARP family transcriptional activator/ATP/maltotriose-dependent transcriptional regulator MalT